MPAEAGGGGEIPKLVKSVYSRCIQYSICPKYCLGKMVNIGWCADKLPPKVEVCESDCGLKHSDVQIIKSDILRHTGVCCYKEIHGVECPKCADGKCPCARDRSTADLQAIMVGICPDGESNYDKTKNARQAYIAREKAKLEKAKEKAAIKAAEERRLTEVVARNEAAEEAAEEHSPEAVAKWEELCAYRNRLLTENAELEQQIRDEERRLREVDAQIKAAKEAAEAARIAAVKARVAELRQGVNPANVDEVATEAPVAPAENSYAAALLKSDVKPASVIKVATKAPVAPAKNSYVAAAMRGLKPASVDEGATEAPVASAEERKRKEYQRLEALTPKERDNYVCALLTEVFDYADKKGWALIVDKDD